MYSIGFILWIVIYDNVLPPVLNVMLYLSLLEIKYRLLYVFFSELDT
jgi:hypothetical protein